MLFYFQEDDMSTVWDIFEKKAKRTIPIMGDITTELSEQVIPRLLQLQSESDELITLFIASKGGRVHRALAICDLIMHVLTVPVNGVAFGMCNSAASYILLHCNKRIATPHTEFLIHSTSINNCSISFDGTEEQHVRGLLDDGRKTQIAVEHMYQERLGMSAEKVKALMHRGDRDFDSCLSAQDALAIGLITEIAQGKIDIFCKH